MLGNKGSVQASLEAQSHAAAAQERLRKNFERLSSGLRVNSAADDAAALSISESLRNQVSGFAIAERNASSGIGLAQVGTGTFDAIATIMYRMRDLAVQASNGDLTNTDRTYLNTEFYALRSEYFRIQEAASYNGVSLITNQTQTFTFQVGTGTTSNDRVSVAVDANSGWNFGIDTVDTSANAQTAITSLDSSIVVINKERALYGAFLNRLQSVQAAIQSMRTNLAAARSNLVDVDVAAETAALTRNQVLSQAATAVISQANQGSNLALTLLR